MTFSQFPKICKKMKNHAFEIWVQFFAANPLFKIGLCFALFYFALLRLSWRRISTSPLFLDPQGSSLGSLCGY